MAKKVSKKTSRKPAAAPKPKAKKKLARTKRTNARAGAEPAAGRRRPKTTSPAVLEQTGDAAASNASGLNVSDLQQFREALLAKRAELTGDLLTMTDQALGSAEQAGDNSRMPLHMADAGSDNFEQEFTLGLIQGERRLLGEIDEAIQRIDDGTYGLCLATGKPIGKRRLRARPWAKYCYEYTLAQERGRRLES